jgi:pimeloyl-ACP methyl ester carboxylesterase
MFEPVELAQDTSANWMSYQWTLQASQSASAPPVVVTLVHGTFAKGAPWTKDGSILRQQIAAELGSLEHDVIFDVFEWSGRNTHKARVKAGYRLADHIRELRKRYPIAKHFIVAHSHGGNVALLAHKHLEPHLHATGVATLGTPFIYAELADNLKGQSLDALMAQAAPEPDNVSGFVAWIVGIPAAIMYDDWLEKTSFNAWYWFVGAAIATGLSAGYLATLIVPYLARAWHRVGGKRAAARLAQAIAFGPMPRTHVLSFVYPGDKAGRLLDTLGATTAWPTRAIRWIKDRAAIVGGAAFAFAIGLSVITTIAADFVAIDAKRIEDYASSGFAFVVVATIYILIGLAVLRYFLSFFRGHPAGYGWERPSIHAHVTIDVESRANLPEARSNLCEIVPFTAADDAKRGLRHSGLYEDKRILKALAYWMANVK